MEITIHNIDGQDFYNTTVKGVNYLIYENNKKWIVKSSRVGLSRTPGTVKTFDKLSDIESIKNLKNMSLMIA